MARYIKNPPVIDQKNLITGESIDKPLTFREFIVGTLLNDVRFSTNFKSLRSANNIIEAIDKGDGKAWTRLEDADYDLLKSVADEPHFPGPPPSNVRIGYPHAAFIQVFPFIDAIMEATNKEPAAE